MQLRNKFGHSPALKVCMQSLGKEVQEMTGGDQGYSKTKRLEHVPLHLPHLCPFELAMRDLLCNLTDKKGFYIFMFRSQEH